MRRPPKLGIIFVLRSSRTRLGEPMAFQDEYTIIERIAGTGTVAGAGITEPLPVRYELVIKEPVKGSPDAPAPEQKMSGKIWSTDEPFLAARLLLKELTLSLADARTWDFQFTHRNGEVSTRGPSLSVSLH